MNGGRAKKIRKLVLNKCPSLYMMVRNQCGEKTKDMGIDKIYRVSKKLWKNHSPGINQWK